VEALASLFLVEALGVFVLEADLAPAFASFLPTDFLAEAFLALGLASFFPLRPDLADLWEAAGSYGSTSPSTFSTSISASSLWFSDGS